MMEARQEPSVTMLATAKVMEPSSSAMARMVEERVMEALRPRVEPSMTTVPTAKVMEAKVMEPRGRALACKVEERVMEAEVVEPRLRALARKVEERVMEAKVMEPRLSGLSGLSAEERVMASLLARRVDEEEGLMVMGGQEEVAAAQPKVEKPAAATLLPLPFRSPNRWRRARAKAGPTKATSSRSCVLAAVSVFVSCQSKKENVDDDIDQSPGTLRDEMMSDFGVSPPVAAAVKSLLEFGERGRIRVSLIMRLGKIYHSMQCFALNSTAKAASCIQGSRPCVPSGMRRRRAWTPG